MGNMSLRGSGISHGQCRKEDTHCSSSRPEPFTNVYMANASLLGFQAAALDPRQKAKKQFQATDILNSAKPTGMC